MDLYTTIGVALILIVVAVILIWKPWKQEELDLITREETEDLVKTPAHLDNTVNTTVEEIIKKPKRAVVKKAPAVAEVDMCEMGGDTDVAIRRSPRKKKVTI